MLDSLTWCHNDGARVRGSSKVIIVHPEGNISGEISQHMQDGLTQHFVRTFIRKSNWTFICILALFDHRALHVQYHEEPAAIIPAGDAGDMSFSK